MENFTAWNPTRLVFGKESLLKMNKFLNDYGSKVLLIYGKESIKKNGIYDIVKQILLSCNKQVYEYSGIKSNPLASDAQNAAKIVYDNKIDLIIAVGGGSVIDTAKLVALCGINNNDVWAVMKYEIKPKKAIPLFSVLTLAATGTEMNCFAVLQNQNTLEKIGFGSPLIYPAVSFLDPSYTTTVPKDYTAYGIADVFAHCLEAFFGEGDAPLSDKIIISILKETIEIGPLLLENLNNYDLRERLLWASTLALNGLTLYGKKSGDWAVHDIGHTISFLYDSPHGATLSIAYPAWLKHMMPNINKQLSFLGKELFNVNSANETINRIESFFKTIKCPTQLNQLSCNCNKNDIANLLMKNKVSGLNFKLTNNDLIKIVDFM